MAGQNLETCCYTDEGHRKETKPKKILQHSQKCLAALVGPRTCLQLVRVLHRAAYHFKDISIINY